MSVRYYDELGENLQKIISRLMANDDLVKLLYYNDTDPLSHDNLTSEQKRLKVFNKLIKIVPRVTTQETTQSIITILVNNATTISSNKEFQNISITVEVFTPWD
jgi:hypothetical protein